jgi:hypothetical protein
MDLIEPSFDAPTFTRNRQRLLKHALGQRLFDEAGRIVRASGSLA